MKIKQILYTTTMIVVMVFGAMVFSAFTKPNHDTQLACINTGMNDNNNWKLFRENVAYCDGEKDVCSGTGYVWINTDTYQIAFSFSRGSSSTKYDLTQTSKKEGYNMRFWYNNRYWYVYINVPEPIHHSTPNRHKSIQRPIGN